LDQLNSASLVVAIALYVLLSMAEQMNAYPIESALYNRRRVPIESPVCWTPIYRLLPLDRVGVETKVASGENYYY